MREINKIGVFIRNGLTSAEIKKKVKDFPDNPDSQYFINLGYSKKTASTYKSQLAKNNSVLLQQQKIIEANSFLHSPNANLNNVILDTSALGFSKPVSMLNECKKITVLYSTIREFDKIQKSESKSSYLRMMIREQINTMLLPQNEQKYNLVAFDWQSNMYVDDIIINYMVSLPANQRPTLLTADHNLALKAKCLKLDYILFLEDSITSKEIEDHINDIKEDLINNGEDEEKAEIKVVSDNTSQQKVKDTINNLGIKIMCTQSSIKVCKYSKTSVIFIVKNNTCKKIGDKQLQYGEIDYFTIVAKPKKYNSIHIQKIWITNGKIQNEKFECHDTNDIKELNKVFIPAILDYAISLLS